MKQHKIIMRPAGFGMLPKRFIPEGAEMIGAVTAAALLGTIDSNGKVFLGLLNEDKTFVIEDVHKNTIMYDPLLICLRMGRVDRHLATGHLLYDIKARLVFVTQPFVPSYFVKTIFDIEAWEPDIVKRMEAVE